MDGLWRKIGKIYCINLETRDDKYDHCRRIFRGLEIPAEFYRPSPHPTSGVQGCFESHTALIKKAYDEGYQRALIFEDDIQPREITSEKLKEILDFLDLNQDWDIFFLGILVSSFDIPRKMGKHIYRVKSTGAHAYVINRKYMEKRKDLKFDGRASDDFSDAETYGVYPSLFYQGGFSSDVQGSDGLIKKIRKIAVDPYKHSVIMPINEMVAINWIEMLAAIVLVIFLFLLLRQLKK